MEKICAAARELIERARRDERRKREFEGSFVENGGVVMRYKMTISGKKEESGYPLFIALHGGGQSDTPELNDSQWEIMSKYYLESVKNGIYAAPRGIRDTWNTHFNPESYGLYKRLIQNMIIFCGADPNRVYLLGYSAGGDGVYQIAPRMADYFAAANMSAGHPNSVSLENLKNVPFYIQCGENDGAYGRNAETERYARSENVTAAFIHKGKGHQIRDNSDEKQILKDGTTADTNVVRLLEKHKRNPYPDKIVWNLDYKTEDRFYYVKSSANSGLIRGEKRGNIFTVDGAADEILINELFVDFSCEVTVFYNGREMRFSPRASAEVIERTFKERCDEKMTFSCVLNLRNGGVNI